MLLRPRVASKHHHRMLSAFVSRATAVLGPSLVAVPLILTPALTGCPDPNAAGACDDIKRTRSALDARLISATKAGLAEARLRQVPELPDDGDVPAKPYLESGELHPLVKKWAFDGDKNLRGEGPTLGVLKADLQQALATGKDCPEAKP